MTNILLLGNSGQVGWELRHALAPLGNLVSFGRAECDLTQLDVLRTLLRAQRPQVIVNAAAYTAVDKAETEPTLAHRINAEVVSVLAEEAARKGILLVHYSTDYVFDGTKLTEYTESDETNPLSVYGRTKLAGEEAIRASGCDHLLFRTSWVFAARGGNFLRTILRLASEREKIHIVSDQYGAPTSAELIADVTALCLHEMLFHPESRMEKTGTYHLVSEGATSWHEYAVFIVREAIQRGWSFSVRPDTIIPIPTKDYPAQALRPLNSRLSTEKLRTSFGLTLPAWQYLVTRVMDTL